MGSSLHAVMPDWIREGAVTSNVPYSEARPCPTGCLEYQRIFMVVKWRGRLQIDNLVMSVFAITPDTLRDSQRTSGCYFGFDSNTVNSHRRHGCRRQKNLSGSNEAISFFNRFQDAV